MSSNFVNLQHPAPIRQPMFDGKGNLTRPWLLYFIGGGTTAQIVEQINEQISGSSQLSGFDNFNQRDFSGDIEAAARLLLSENARDYSPEIEAIRNQLSAASSPRDFTDAIEELKADSCPLTALGLQQQLDELRVLIASGDVPAGATVAAGGALLAANNLSDVASASASRTNLGLGNAVTQSIRTITASATLLAADGTVLCDATSAAITATLPASPATGTILNVKKIDASANALTIDGNGALIEGWAQILVTDQGTSLDLQYDGTSWRIE